jgi:hypothetical protein
MWRRVGPVRTEVSEEYIASIIKVKRISRLGMIAATEESCEEILTRLVALFRSVLHSTVTVNVVLSSLNLSTLMMEATYSPETLILTITTQRYIPGYCILQMPLSLTNSLQFPVQSWPVYFITPSGPNPVLTTPLCTC